MIWLVLGMLLAVGLASFVLATVALPARRAGRPMFTPRGARLLRIGDPAIRPSRPKPSPGGAGKVPAEAVGAEEPSPSSAGKDPATSAGSKVTSSTSALGEKPAKAGSDKA